MVYDCGACIAKYLLCCFNFIIFITGSIVLAVGIWLAVDKNSFIALSKIVPSEHVEQFTQPAVIEQASYILIAAGAFMFIVSFLGYCGALRESQCLLTTYGICLILILILEVTAGGLAAAYKGKAEEQTRKYLKTTIQQYYTSGNRTDAVTLMWNHLQAQLSCCGVDSADDFRDAPNWDSSRGIPESCCVLIDKTTFKSKPPSCMTSPNSSNSYYDKGCYDALINWIRSHMNIIIGIGIGLGVLQLLGIFLAFCLCKTIDGYIK
ncbi:hypothetical protein ILUMI_21064 [Ignelater luminosus]|uniref:Tetraspanin n=1 Tax=Ignelater luminosus TaxID=2038154 RepID=A0A8K0CJM4_IGNLU|nr:hypothetical protein ILUMI_21064 [Ignelater luminosus]